MLDVVAKRCQYLLYNYGGAQHCLQYLDSRISRETQETFGFGYFPRYNELYLLLDSIDFSNLEALGLVSQRFVEDSISSRYVSTTFFDNHSLIMPYNNAYNSVIALVGRSLLNDLERKENKVSKYKNTVFQKQKNLFGLDKAKREIYSKNKVYIVEGQFDAIKAYEAGLKNVVAVGNANLSEYQLSILLRYTDNICICFDNDAAGRSGANKAVVKYSKHCNISEIKIPTGYKDLDEFFSENSLSDFLLII